jgi:hypothetical protein
MRLVPQRYNLVRALEVQESGKVPRTACPLPSDIAAVLTGLSMVTNAQYQSITIEGGIGTGWIAAVAEWLYRLTVTIFDKRDVNIYTTARRPLAAQVSIHLGRDPTRVPSDRALSVISRTYKLNDIVDIMKTMSINELPMYGGRLAWSTCLSDAYGIEFVQLMEQSDIFGRAFGCAGRIFKAIYGRTWSRSITCTLSLELFRRIKWRRFCHDCHRFLPRAAAFSSRRSQSPQVYFA